MICIFFPAGAFGSTLEFSIREFSAELESIPTSVLPDGSMHGFIKEFHTGNLEQLKFLDPSTQIITPWYPSDGLTIEETINKFNEVIPPNLKIIFILLSTDMMAERNELFAFHKCGIQDFEINKKDITKWNKTYQTFDCMKDWEKRELLSFHFNDHVVKQTEAKKFINSKWLVLTPDDILYDFKNSIKKTIEFCNLTFVAKDIDKFYLDWFEKQKYILEEYKTVCEIVEAVKKDKKMTWQKLSIKAEALIQYKLEKEGFSLLCFDLNEFPRNTDSLKKFLQQHNT